jgi:peptide/nickel transport system substrate-binding protein
MLVVAAVRRARRLAVLVMLAPLALTVLGAGPAAGAATALGRAATALGRAASGKSITVLENAADFDWPTGLDPATDTEAGANAPYFDAIYGDLFVQGPGTTIAPGLARGYSVTDGGRIVTISLRPGVRFQDGTAFDAQAVAYNLERDLNPKYACACLPDFPVSQVSTPNSSTVVITLSHPFAPIMEAFIDSPPNWIVSPSALARLGEKQFSVMPVGAGPFEVVLDETNAKLELKRFAGYWQKGRPYLDSVSFVTIGNDESAYEALLTGEGAVYQGLTLRSIEQEAAKRFAVVPAQLTEPYVIQLNTSIPPFNNILAREAIYYATDVRAIDKGLAADAYPISESPTGPDGLFYEPKVPGYRTYDLSKAKALVKRLGGLSVNLGTINEVLEGEVDEALSAQWAKAGIKTTLSSYSLEPLIASFRSDRWQAMLQSTGDTDPALGIGLSARFLSNGAFSGIHDPKLDSLIDQAADTINVAARARLYREAFAYIAKQAYAPFLFTVPLFYTVTSRSVSGPGLTTSAPQISWADVSVR